MLSGCLPLCLPTPLTLCLLVAESPVVFWSTHFDCSATHRKCFPLLLHSLRITQHSRSAIAVLLCFLLLLILVAIDPNHLASTLHRRNCFSNLKLASECSTFIFLFLFIIIIIIYFHLFYI